MSNKLLDLAIGQGQARDARDAGEITEMRLDVGEAKSLDGMAEFANLQSLQLFASKTVSLKGLAPLRSLRALTMGAYAVQDVAALESLPLRRLQLTAQRVPDLRGLSSNTMLELSVWNGGLRSLDGMTLPRLRRLDVSMNKIDDLAPLAKFSALRNLNLQNNPAADIGVLASFAEMRVLSLCGMKKVKELAPLGSLHRLSQLTLTGVGAKKRDAVAHVAKDAVCDVGGMGVGEGLPRVAWPEAVVRAGLASEDEIAEVVEWDASEWSAADWQGASSLSGLLTLLANPVTTMAGIESSPSVLSLVVRCVLDDDGNPVPMDFSGLSRARGLVRMQVQHPIDSLERLPALPRLRHLHVHSSPGGAVALEGLQRFESLGTLSVSGRVADEGALARMPNIRLVRV